METGWKTAEEAFAFSSGMKAVLEQQGCEITGGGYGLGAVHLEFTHNGVDFGMKVWPRTARIQIEEDHD